MYIILLVDIEHSKHFVDVAHYNEYAEIDSSHMLIIDSLLLQTYIGIPTAIMKRTMVHINPQCHTGEAYCLDMLLCPN